MEELRKNLNILIAEDNLINQKLAVRLLQKQGHSSHVANNGAEAVQAWETQTFDVILMDVMMPELDGLTATMQIREREKPTGKRIPIIAMTANAMVGDRERCLEAGMDDYLPKPIDIAKLTEVLNKIAQA